MLNNGDRGRCLDNKTYSEIECVSKNDVVKVIFSGWMM